VVLLGAWVRYRPLREGTGLLLWVSYLAVVVGEESVAGVEWWRADE
jgi:cytochrome c-type biogenesis protein CcmH/NrfF